ncbi:hypothetical protein [Streptomyces sp. NBC_00019]|uniref:hypothetical protein n=1 Tax=Streptomyces sp. NBC_00019 TaxID=2975623 RepID=UPI003245A186
MAKDVTNYTSVTGNENKVATGAAGGDLRLDATFADSPEGAAKLKAAQARVAELRKALEHHGGEVGDIDGCNEAVALIDEELGSAEPRQRSLKVALGALVAAIGTAAQVLLAAESLRGAINTLFT